MKKLAYRGIFLLLLSTFLLLAVLLTAILGQVSSPTPPGQQRIILVHGYMDSGDAMVMPILKENLVKIGYRASDIYISLALVIRLQPLIHQMYMLQFCYPTLSSSLKRTGTR